MTAIRILLAALTVVAGIVAGLAVTQWATNTGAALMDTRVAGWAFSSRIGAPSIDPYTRARLFTSGELPLASGEGYALVAWRSNDGPAFDARCRYRLTGPMPPARYWTLTLTDASGRIVDNLADRHGFTSAEIIRMHDGGFAIEIGPDALPGNWLPSGQNGGAFVLTVRLYETPLSATATILDNRTVPRVEKLRCPA